MNLKLLSLAIACSVILSNCNNSSQKQSEDYIKERIIAIYNLDCDDRESKFTSKSYYELWEKVKEKDSLLDGETGLFDYNHWYQAQDFDNPQVNVVSINKLSDTTATAVVRITNFGENTNITFSLVFESNDWFIDDIIRESDSLKKSEKAIMQSYLETFKLH